MWEYVRETVCGPEEGFDAVISIVNGLSPGKLGQSVTLARPLELNLMSALQVGDIIYLILFSTFPLPSPPQKKKKNQILSYFSGERVGQNNF